MKSGIKRLWATFLTLAMVTGLVSGAGVAVYADASTPSDFVVDNNDDESTLPNKVVTFNGYNWYITKVDTTANTATLFAEGNNNILIKSVFGGDISYSTSDVKTYLDDLTADGKAFAAVKDVIKDTDLSDVGVTGAKLYIPSKGEAEGINKKVLKLSDTYDPVNAYDLHTGWWTRTVADSENVYRCDYNNSDYFNKSHVSIFGGSECFIRPMLTLDLDKVSFKNKAFKVKGPERSVTLTGGANAKVSPAEGVSQTVEDGEAMKTVTYTADKGYFFDKFDDIKDHGVTAKRTSSTKVTVSGIPTDNVSIKIPDAVQAKYYKVTLTGGANATASPADGVSQNVIQGEAMTEVRFTANDGYSFEKFTDKKEKGIEVTLNGQQVIVSGTPTADVSIAVPDAVKVSDKPEETGKTDDKPSPAEAAAAAKAQGKGSLDPNEVSVTPVTNGKKTVYTISSNVISGNGIGVLTILKGEKVNLPGFDKKTSKPSFDKKTLAVSGKGQLKAKKVTPGSALSYTTDDGKTVKLNVIVSEPSIENAVSGNSVSSNLVTVESIKKLNVTVSGTGEFDLRVNAPLTINATDKAKTKGDIKVADSKYISIDKEGKLHIAGTVTGKGNVKIPFTAYGKKYTIKIKAKGVPKTKKK